MCVAVCGRLLGDRPVFTLAVRCCRLQEILPVLLCFRATGRPGPRPRECPPGPQSYQERCDRATGRSRAHCANTGTRSQSFVEPGHGAANWARGFLVDRGGACRRAAPATRTTSDCPWTMLLLHLSAALSGVLLPRRARPCYRASLGHGRNAASASSNGRGGRCCSSLPSFWGLPPGFPGPHNRGCRNRSVVITIEEAKPCAVPAAGVSFTQDDSQTCPPSGCATRDAAVAHRHQR